MTGLQFYRGENGKLIDLLPFFTEILPAAQARIQAKIHVSDIKSKQERRREIAKRHIKSIEIR